MQKNPMFEKDAEVDAQVDALYSVVKGRIDWGNPIPICLELAKELEGMTQLKGGQRLELLQKTLRHAVKESDMKEEEKASSITFVDTLLPVVMQAAILASKSPIAAHLQTVCCGISRKK
jgi:hypothetical protein